MNIKRHANEKSLSHQFQEDQLKCYCLTPGIAKKSNDLISNKSYSFMCSVKMQKEIEKFFGKSDYFVDGKQNQANFFAFEFNKKIIVCICENDSVGAGWYWVSPEKGSRYGNPMLLSCDKEVKDFWPDFCNELKKLIDKKPTSNAKIKIR